MGWSRWHVTTALAVGAAIAYQAGDLLGVDPVVKRKVGHCGLADSAFTVETQRPLAIPFEPPTLPSSAAISTPPEPPESPRLIPEVDDPFDPARIGLSGEAIELALPELSLVVLDAAVRSSAEVKQCFVQEREATGGLYDISVRMRIEPTGEVTSTLTPSASTGLARCIDSALRTLDLPAFRGDAVMVTYPMRVSSSL